MTLGSHFDTAMRLQQSLIPMCGERNIRGFRSVSPDMHVFHNIAVHRSNSIQIKCLALWEERQVQKT